MADVGHSRLLKFLVKEKDSNKMAAPVFNIEYEYITPTNIESEVPGTQHLREAHKDTTDENSTVSLENKVESPGDFVLSPVITVTKQESEYTKGDLKLQKVSVTESISEVIGAVYYTTNSNPNIKSEVISTQPVRVIEDDRKTRIPTLKSRQERRGSSDKKDEVPPPRFLQKRSSIPRLKDSRIPPPLDRRASKTEIKVETPQPDDEFEKIYDEIITEPKEIVTDVIESIKVEDPEKLDNKFEEIIHDYEDNTVHPITEDIPIVDKPRSKIPLSKRKSEQDIKIPKPAERTTVKKDESRSDKIETRIPMHKDLPHKAVRTKYNLRNVDKPNDVNKIGVNLPKSIEKQKVEDIKHNNVATRDITKQKMIENFVNEDNKPISNGVTEIIDTNYVELDNNVQNEPEIIIEPVQQTEVEIKAEANIVFIKPIEVINETKPIETESYTNKTNGIIPRIESNIDSKDDEKENMDIECKPGKVSRLLQRIRSQEFTTDNIVPKKENLVDVPKKKSVLSKIAMFERQESEEDHKPISRIKPPITKPIEPLNKELVHRAPIIVDELLKESNMDSIDFDYNAEYASAGYLNNLNTDYTVDIEEVKVKYHKLQENNVEESKTNIVDNISSPITNNRIILDKPVEFPKETEIESMTLNKSKFEPDSTRNEVEITKQSSRELLEPPAENLEEKVPQDIVIETFEHTSTEYNIKAPINKEEKSLDSTYNSDSFNYEPNTLDNKVEIPIENITLQETKIETIEFESIASDNTGVNANDVFSKDPKVEKWRVFKENSDIKKERPKSVAEEDLGDVVKGKVHQMIVTMNSCEKIDNNRKEINHRERPRKKSVSKIIALFEQKSIQIEPQTTYRLEIANKTSTPPAYLSEEIYQEKMVELANGKLVYGRMENMTYMVLSNGVEMPVLALGTALLEKRLVRPVIEAAIDMGYRAIDTAFIYGNEKEVGDAIKAKIDDGTVTRPDLFIISKLWSTFHRPDLVATACNASLKAMGLKYFDLYLIHNPVSFKEGSDPIPKIANVIQYSSSDFMDAWFGMEALVTKGLVKSIGLSNFNSRQVQRVLDKARVKPVINQVECHPYLSQRKLDEFCSARDIKLSCFGVLGSKGTPKEFKSGLEAAIDDPMVQVMAAGLNITAAQLLIRYQIDIGHNVVVKASTAAHLWDNLQALNVTLDPTNVKGLQALNKDKRIFTFVGIGDTHRNYPFRIPF